MPSGVGSSNMLRTDESPVTADLISITSVALMERHELDAAVAVQLVIAGHKRLQPMANRLLSGKWAALEVWPVFFHPESNSEYGFSFTAGSVKKYLNTPSSSKRLSNVAGRVASPL